MSDQKDDVKSQTSIISYTAPWTIYGMDWCDYDVSFQRQRILLSSYKPDYSNGIQVYYELSIIVQIISFNRQAGVIEKLHELNTMYPPTKVMWIPDPQPFHSDVLAFSGDYLRIYRLDNGTSSPIVDAILNKVMSHFVLYIG